VRDVLARSPNDPGVPLGLSEVLAYEGAPEELMRQTLEARWARLSPEERAAREAGERARLAVTYGHFDAAMRMLATRLEALDATAPLVDHLTIARRLADVLVETGSNAAAAKVSRALRQSKTLLLGASSEVDASVELLRYDLWGGNLRWTAFAEA
jgi:hypothetical protein